MKKFISGLMVGAVLMGGVAHASDTKIEAYLTSIKYYFNGVEKASPANMGAIVYKNTTYVPLRFVSQNLGKEIVWDEKTNSAYINDAGTFKAPSMTSYQDGVYRGSFGEGYQQVAVQFEIKNNIVQNTSFRHLYYKDVDYRAEKEDAKVIGLKTQYEALINYLVGKDVRAGIKDLYEPGKIVTSEVDGMTGATLRSGKVISAINDGLNRGVYSYPKK
ncbi:copper amine oxidase N-terminal domain-containing protein [Cellulosilyticum sp. I15G10I2]|uniref:copper amine oxidase N-terminal domain-containing protein n=1 Tax=Cellulosilyticum sp. I15G10I2 TaxID=1892843 RepID=UPI00085C11BC|nr:copper amine oxidase N-terminal domain-containing protein [Cellulosilyticum sp. I15G10I2]